MKRNLMFTMALILLAGYGLKAQILSPVKWSYAAKKSGKNTATLFLKADIHDGWHIYSVTQGEDGPVKTSFKFVDDKSYAPVGKLTEPKPESKMDDTFRMTVSSFSKSVIFQQKIKLNQMSTTVKGSLEYMVCNATQCLPPETVEFSIPVK